MSEPMQGTSIEDIETGNVKHEADSEVMRQIFADMNTVEESAPEKAPAGPTYTTPLPPPRQMPMQPMPTQVPLYAPMYTPPNMVIQEVPEPTYRPVPLKPKQNAWQTAFEFLKEPLAIGLLIAVLLFPKLHTLGSQYLPWAYRVGGHMSWMGVLLCSVLGAGVWSLYKFFA